jgi:hypothetical protein
MQSAVHEDLEVELDLLHRPGAADLHDNLGPVRHGCRVRLAD